MATCSKRWSPTSSATPSSRCSTGESVISPEMMTKLFKAFRNQRRPSPRTGMTAHPPGAPGNARAVHARKTAWRQLSAREREILALIARGDSNKLIARELDIAETTVKIHVQHILRKLNLTSRVQAAVFAVHHRG
jgi:two-component system, NarL family, nitrate/nitrite response regulator NarL